MLYLVVYKTVLCSFSVLISEILISGNEGYPSERVEVFGLYSLWRLWTEEWWSTTDTVWWLWHLFSHILYGSTSGLCTAWQLEMQMVNDSVYSLDFSAAFSYRSYGHMNPYLSKCFHMGLTSTCWLQTMYKSAHACTSSPFLQIFRKYIAHSV